MVELNIQPTISEPATTLTIEPVVEPERSSTVEPAIEETPTTENP